MASSTGGSDSPADPEAVASRVTSASAGAGPTAGTSSASAPASEGASPTGSAVAGAGLDSSSPSPSDNPVEASGMELSTSALSSGTTGAASAAEAACASAPPPTLSSAVSASASLASVATASASWSRGRSSSCFASALASATAATLVSLTVTFVAVPSLSTVLVTLWPSGPIFVSVVLSATFTSPLLSLEENEDVMLETKLLKAENNPPGSAAALTSALCMSARCSSTSRCIALNIWSNPAKGSSSPKNALNTSSASPKLKLKSKPMSSPPESYCRFLSGSPRIS
mmetsp:Transcript_51424/g.103309  ORF Transcript_51424/g.103309 Transcript_51424/m.103309 type:complete len:285 (+) Transcript_51424:965-1819(+)